MLNCSVAVATENKIIVRTAGHDSFPKFYYQTDQFGKQYIDGLGVEILRAIEEIEPRLEFEIHPELIPWRRLQSQLEIGVVDFFVGLVSNEKRRKIYDIVPTPLYELNHVVAVKSTSPLVVNEFNDFIKLGDQGVILTLAGSGTVNYMKKQNADLVIIDQARSIEHGLELIQRGRSNFFYYHDLAIKSAIKNLDLADEVKILPSSFRQYSQYAALSRKLSPEISKMIKNSVETLKLNGTLDVIFKKYTQRISQQRYISGEFMIPQRAE